jgi:polysaccharide export outer membrane protein
VVDQRTFVPPLTIADYRHYLKGEGIIVVPEAGTGLSENAQRTSRKVSSPATDRQPAATTAVATEKPRAGNLPSTSTPADESHKDQSTSKVHNQASGRSRLRVARVLPLKVNAIARQSKESVTVVAQAPTVAKPDAGRAEPKKTESAPIHVEPIPIATEGPPTPLTTSNFLPAYPDGYCFRPGVKCPPCGCNPGGPGWSATRPIPWEVFAQGEYVGPARLAHVPVYRLRVDDQIAFVYRLSGQVSGQPYRLNVRDRIQIQSLSAPEVVNREVIIEPDGTISLPLLGQVRAAGATLNELREHLDEQFKRHIRDPRITVTPLEMNSNLQELRSSVDRRYGQGGQVSDARISPDGTVQLPAIGSVPAQGLTLEELEREVKARYAQIVEGLEVTPILTARAPRFVYVVGEVRLPGRYTLEGPTTLMQAIAMAGSWNVGAQLNHVVVFRRDENWQLMATRVNIRESLLFKKPCPSGEIWLRDSDIVLVPKSPILCADDAIELLFTRGLYGVFPMSATLNFVKASTL